MDKARRRLPPLERTLPLERKGDDKDNVISVLSWPFTSMHEKKWEYSSIQPELIQVPVIAFLSFLIAEYTVQPLRSLFINVHKTALKSTNARPKRLRQNRKTNRNSPGVQFKCPIVGSTSLWLPLIAVGLWISSDNSTVC